MVTRKTRILYEDKLFNYPLELFDTLTKLAPTETLKCLTSYLGEYIVPTAQDGTFESWVCHRFGRRLYDIFFKTYSEKLWGIPCTELDDDFAAQRIKKLSLFSAIQAALYPAARKRHRTLEGVFAYPLEGTGMVYRRMAATIQKRGGELHLKSPVKRVCVEKGRVTGVECKSGKTVPCECVISTMPLTTMVKQLGVCSTFCG